MAAHLRLLCYTNKEATDKSCRGAASECCNISSRDEHMASYKSKSEHSSVEKFVFNVLRRSFISLQEISIHITDQETWGTIKE
jgi:hypothetical protein